MKYQVRLDQQQPNPFIEAALTDQWAEEREYIKNDPIQTIQDFINNRIKLVDIISAYSMNFHFGIWFPEHPRLLIWEV